MRKRKTNKRQATAKQPSTKDTALGLLRRARSVHRPAEERFRDREAEGRRRDSLFDYRRAGRVKKADRITAEVRALAALDLHGLRVAWRKRYGEPPKMRSRELLARLLAWRIQADAFGGLDATTIRLLNADTLPPPNPRLQPGTRLTREWQGQRHDVDVLETGFRYDGKDFRSLSQVARTITRTRWNGLRFFGLREPAK